MSPEELEHGYASSTSFHTLLFGDATPPIGAPLLRIWRCLTLYKRSNRFWRLLIKHHLVHAVWRPLVELTRLRHVRFRQELAASEPLNRPGANVITASV